MTPGMNRVPRQLPVAVEPWSTPRLAAPSSLSEGSPEELRLRALVDVLREKLDEAAERGVEFAQAAPWRKAELVAPGGSY